MLDAQTLQALFGGKPKRRKATAFQVGEQVVYCGYAAVVVAKAGRVYQVECNGEIYPSNGKDLKKIPA